MDNEINLDAFDADEMESFDLSEVFDSETLRDFELSSMRESDGIY